MVFFSTLKASSRFVNYNKEIIQMVQEHNVLPQKKNLVHFYVNNMGMRLLLFR